MSSKSWEVLQCKKGTFKLVKNKNNGAVRYKEMTKAELAEAEKEDDGQPCQCKQCVLQRKNSLNAPVGSSRLPKKDAFTAKYGTGKKLGGAPSKG